MITKHTTFILGAGASNDYSYLLGVGLKQQICNNLNRRAKRDKMIRVGFSEKTIDEFTRNFQKCNLLSIDTFLEKNKKFEKIGKVAIALALIPLEVDNLGVADKWYSYLYNKILSPNFEKFEHNKVGFITFNYDRSLEHFLITSLMYTNEKNEEECAEKIKKIPIIHVYGQLGYLPWQNKAKIRLYGSGIGDRAAVIESAECIKIMHERRDEANLLEAYALLERTEQIVFLGFGYDRTNIDRLKISEHCKGKDIYGTTKGLGRGEILIAHKALRQNHGGLVQLDIEGEERLDILTYIRKYIIQQLHIE